jgi:hypothetical protein
MHFKYRISYLDSVRIISEVHVFRVEESSSIRIISGQFPPFKSLLNLRDSPATHSKISDEHSKDDDLHGRVVKEGSPVISEEDHYSVVRIVLRIIRILRVDSSLTPKSVPEGLSLSLMKNQIKPLSFSTNKTLFVP